MRREFTLLTLLVVAGPALGQQIPASQKVEAQDYVEALRQQREEAQDKLANAYMVINKLQRELDRLKAEAVKSVNPPH